MENLRLEVEDLRNSMKKLKGKDKIRSDTSSVDTCSDDSRKEIENNEKDLKIVGYIEGLVEEEEEDDTEIVKENDQIIEVLRKMKSVNAIIEEEPTSMKSVNAIIEEEPTSDIEEEFDQNNNNIETDAEEFDQNNNNIETDAETEDIINEDANDYPEEELISKRKTRLPDHIPIGQQSEFKDFVGSMSQGVNLNGYFLDLDNVYDEQEINRRIHDWNLGMFIALMNSNYTADLDYVYDLISKTLIGKEKDEERRKSFTDHLYSSLCQAGVNTFRDDEGIQKGKSISDELLKAIEGSKISIIVFSKTYARSRWCLDELVKIVECKQNLGQMVLPIFYDVDPSEVRKQTREFGDSLIQHRERFGDQRVDEWKAALTTVANLSGWDLQIMANGYESKFVKRITKEVLRKVNRTYINVAKYPVGIDSRVRDILHLLQTQTNDHVKMIGIFGMGGVGKTTLAKAIYNLSYQRFDGYCFIANIRSQVSEGHSGLVRLQEKLLCKTLNTKKLEIDNVDEGISLIKERLRSKRVLNVLDDIDDISQLESLAGHRNWFGSSSTIIITTRDVHLLSDLRAHEKYMVKTLNFFESFQLLSWHAFGVSEPLEEYTEVSERIASYTGGLPLALTIIGSHLRGRSVQEWIDNAEKLRKIPNDKVQNILKISYDALDDDTKNIFLDIACFFIGDDKNDTSIILEACGFHAKIGIKTLIERCLLTIDGDGVSGKLQMHDLVQDMGREIVQKESPRDPGKQSRLVDPKDVFDVLHGDKGTEAIEGIIVNSYMLGNVPLSTKVFTRMVKLRILILGHTCLSGSFKYLSNELRLFRLHNCHLSCIPSNFRCEKLVELDMKGSNIKELQCNMKHFRCLRILKLDYCQQLKKTPNFTGAHTLQKVSFKGCSNLVKVHPSIGSLERLVELDFESCRKLKILPNSICKLKSLEVLCLEECKKLRELPIELGKLENLRDLLARRTAISHIPFSLGCLRNLKRLDLGEHKSSVLSHLKSQLLDILSPHLLSRRRRFGVGFFPPSVANLSSLEVLSVSYNYLHEVDFRITLENLTSLVSLDLSGSCYLQCLPFGLCHLSNLKRLYLDNLQNLRILEELPLSLEILSAKKCVSLKKIAYISNLKRLQALFIGNCKSLVELPNMESVSSLVELDISNCNALTIPDKYLHEDDDLPIALRSLSSLRALDLMGRYYLQSLPLSLFHHSNLRNLYLDDWQNLRSLPQLPPNLVILSAKNCVSLEKIADLSNLKRLEWLDFQNCKSLVELSGLESLESLHGFGIANCNGVRIPSIEKWFKARSKGDSVEISLQVGVGSVFCNFPIPWGDVKFQIMHNVIDPSEIDGCNGIRLSVRSKSSGAWILKEPNYISINVCYNIKVIGYDSMFFEVPTRMGEVLEVYAEFNSLEMIFCLFEIHRNREGEVRFFPSSRGFIPASS
ncbi:TMV resistance protein N-like [Ipomoea triloba]|uniref:TMV resistance protein N-like n=1 Tax=Ipomoea triloba TaxID=35885 RepID=UPI00125E9D3D|nr:TMV resistance protein N-like [Ipomoea triloba]